MFTFSRGRGVGMDGVVGWGMFLDSFFLSCGGLDGQDLGMG